MAIKTFSAGSVLTASDTNTYLANAGLVYVASYTFSSNTAPYIDGCFTSTYDQYKVVVNCTADANAQALFKFRTGGVDNTATNYWWGGYYLNMSGGAALTAENSSSAIANGRYAALTTAGTNFAEITIASPYSNTAKTVWTSEHQSAEAYTRFITGYFNDTTRFDGIKIYGATLTGTMTVYGMRKA